MKNNCFFLFFFSLASLLQGQQSSIRERDFIGIVVSPDIVDETAIKPFYDSLAIKNIWSVQAGNIRPAIRYTVGFRYASELMYNFLSWEMGLDFSDKGGYAQSLRQPGGWHFNRYFLEIPGKINMCIGKQKYMFCFSAGGILHYELTYAQKRLSISYLVSSGFRVNWGPSGFLRLDLAFKQGKNPAPSYLGANVINKRWSLGLNLGCYLYLK